MYTLDVKTDCSGATLWWSRRSHTKSVGTRAVGAAGNHHRHNPVGIGSSNHCSSGHTPAEISQCWGWAEDSRHHGASWDWREQPVQQPASDASHSRASPQHQQQQHRAAAGQHQQTTSAAAGSSSNSWCAGISQPEATQQNLIQNLPAVADLTLQEVVSMQTSRMLPSIMMNTMCHNLCLDTEVVCAHTVTLMLSCYMCVPLSRSRWAPKSGLIGTLWIRRHWFSQVGCLSCIGGSSLRSVVFLSCSLAILACVVAACLS